MLPLCVATQCGISPSGAQDLLTPGEAQLRGPYMMLGSELGSATFKALPAALLLLLNLKGILSNEVQILWLSGTDLIDLSETGLNELRCHGGRETVQPQGVRPSPDAGFLVQGVSPEVNRIHSEKLRW